MRNIASCSVAVLTALIVLPVHARWVDESARKIPIAYDVDVLVVGGSTGAVSAAVSASENGAKVFLAAPRPYLGEDMCATMRLWLEAGEMPSTLLAQRIFAEDSAARRLPNALRLTYEADLPSSPKHPDTKPPRRLADGIPGPAESHSVQYDGDVTITADLSSAQAVQSAQIILFHRVGGDFNPENVAIATSADRQTWKDLGTFKCDKPSAGSIVVQSPVDAKIRYARFKVKRAQDATRILVGEITLTAPQPVAPAADAKVNRSPVRPLHVKKTLDEALLAARVQYLYGCYATDVLRDAEGRPCGIVMANRAGRQAVLAKVIIDATDRAMVARMAGVQFAPYPAGSQTFQYHVIGGEMKEGPNIRARQAAVGYGDTAGAAGSGFAGYPIIEYTMQIPMVDGSFASFARAEQTARDLTYSETWEANTDEPFQTPPDPMKGVRTVSWTSAREVNLDGFRPMNTQRVYVLGGCADVARGDSPKLLRPVNLMEVGRRIGEAAADEAKATPATTDARLPKTVRPPAVLGDVKEILAGVRPSQKSLPTIESAAQSIPVLGDYDVVVVGGGTGGAPAGISAARNGAKVLVLEYLHGLGGVGTLGLITGYYWGFRGGFTAEIPGGAKWDPLMRAEWYRTEIRKAGGDVWFGVIGCGAFVQDGQVKGAVVATPLGRGVVLAKVVIDATGNADVAAAAGAPTVHTGADEMAQQGTGLPSVKLSASYNNTDFTIVDETDMLDVWHLFVYAKNKYAGSFDIGQLIDTRERRRIVGEFTMTLPDQVNNRTYTDTIALAYSNFDTHGYTVDPYLLVEHPEKKGITVNVPYRCLLPQGLDRMLVTGLGISVHRDAVPLTRMQPDIQNQGYSAGLVAATAAKQDIPLRQVDIKAIQKQLIAKGIVPEHVLSDTDSYPLPDEKIAQAVADVKDGKGMAVIVTHAEKAIPELRKAYAAAKTADQKLIYAKVLAVMGKADGLDDLIRALDAADWDKGWNYTGMGQFGSSLSNVDTLIVALGRAKDKRALPAIIRKARQLDARSEFSHHRAVALAFEAIGDPSAADVLAELLAKPGMRGYVHRRVTDARDATGQNPNDNTTRATSIRELSLARALFRCGDKNGLGRAILTEYTQDLRGHWARHAAAVLEETRQRE